MSPLPRHRVPSLAGALELLREGAVPVGAGIDLLETIAEGLADPPAAVEAGDIHELTGVREEPDGALRLGASTTLAELATHPAVRERFAVLAAACEAAGPGDAGAGTLGGTLCQRPRCSYFRGNVGCFRTGGDSCPAVDGDNRYLAIVEGGPCWIVHPSDVAASLVALDAVLEIAGAAGSREVSAAGFFVLPAERLDRENVLAADELLVAVRLPAASAGGRQRFARVAAEEAMQFSAVSLAAVRRADGEVRLVLGGVAPRPWRVRSSIEEETMTGGLDEDSIESLADRALYDAQPLRDNGYKVDLAAALLRDAIRELSED